MRTRIAIVSGSIVVCLALYAGFSSRGLPSRSTSETRQAAIIYSDATLESNAATALTPRVYGSATPDSVVGRYRYTYTLVNEASSANALWKFVLDPVPHPVVVTAPANWMWAYGFDLRPTALAFGSEGDDTPHSARWDSVSDVPSIYDLQPGDSLSFRFVAPGDPAMIRFYVQGFYNDSLGTEEGGGPPPYSVYKNSVTGSVIGPGTIVVAPGAPGTSKSPEVPKPQAPAQNPAKASATVAFYLPQAGRVQLTVHDASGRLVEILADRPYTAGYYSVIWKAFSGSGKKMPAGEYFFRLSVDGRIVGAQKMIIVR